MNPSILAYTAGEPAGIGIDLAVMISQRQHDYCIVAIADAKVIQARAIELGLPLEIKPFTGTASKPGELQLISTACRHPVETGKLSRHNAGYVLKSLDIAIKGCLSGEFDALVTGPIQKSVINDAGIAFSGHTEYLAEMTAAKLPVMMLANARLRVALVTTHIPLEKVAKAITRSRLRAVIEITHRDLNRLFGLARPRIGICGLNPHAGEGGHLGTEENHIIRPLIKQLIHEGYNLLGPMPADTAFTPATVNQLDAVIAMYHDQGLPVVKALGFGKTVNITLGLPIIRTSVDHGTALNLAGTGNIDTESLHTALAMADQMVRGIRR